MLTILVLLIALLSLALLLLRRDKRGIFLFLSSAALLIFYSTILIYIAKKGGISRETTILLFSTMAFRRRLQYMVLTLQTLGYSMAISKFLFPYFLLMATLTMIYLRHNISFISVAIYSAIIPAVYLVIYFPAIFQRISANTEFLKLAVISSKIWTIAYIAISIFLMFREFISTRFAFYRRRAMVKLFIIASLGLLYTFFIPQDPAQIYLFYKNEYMGSMGLWYLNRGFTSGLYYFMMMGMMLLSMASTISFLRYFYATFGEITEVRHSNNKSRDAMRGVSMFVHGTKNDLLSTEILLKAINERYPDDKDISKLIDINQGLRSRLEQLNRASKINTTTLTPQPLSVILNDAADRTSHRESVEINIENPGMLVLADRLSLSEAIANIIQNAIEATDAAERDYPVIVKAFYDRFWIVITVEDCGTGISKEDGKKLFEPFHSSKNSSTNWGIGMYFTKTIIRNHLGTINFESKEGKGTCFSISLPCVGGIHGRSADSRR